MIFDFGFLIFDFFMLVLKLKYENAIVSETPIQFCRPVFEVYGKKLLLKKYDFPEFKTPIQL